MLSRAWGFLFLALSTHGVFGAVLQGTFGDGNGSIRIVVKDQKIESISLELPKIRLSKYALPKHTGWPDVTDDFDHPPYTHEGVKGWIRVRYISPRVESEVTAQITKFSTASAKVETREKRLSTATGYEQTFTPEAGGSEVVLSQTIDPFSEITALKSNKRLSVETSRSSDELILEIGQKHGSSGAFKFAELRLTPQGKNRWKLKLFSTRGVPTGDIAYSKVTRAVVKLRGSAVIDPASFD